MALPGEETGKTPPDREGGGVQRWILAGLAAGLALGLIANFLTRNGGPAESFRGRLEWAISEVIHPAGGIFLRLLFMTVLPLVVSSLALGIHEMGDLGRIGRIGAKTLLFTLILSSISVLIGLA